MRNFIYLAFLLVVGGLVSCKKDKSPSTIKEYDDAQIKAYIAAKGYTNMMRDTVGGDTTGIYYQVLASGTGAPVDYTTQISYVYTVQSLNGAYTLPDSILNHKYTYLGEETLPGLRLAIGDLVKRMGTSLRLIIPSRLAYGIDGSGVGSNRVPGNQSLDYYVNILNNVSSSKNSNGVVTNYTNTIDSYDDISIQKYIAANNYTGFIKVLPNTTFAGENNIYAGMYYKIRTAGTGIIPITGSSLVSYDYRTQLLNSTVIEPSNYSTTTGIVSSQANYYLNASTGLLPGVRNALLICGSSGAEISFILPSRLAYGLNTVTGYPTSSCVYYDITVDSVTN